VSEYEAIAYNALMMQRYLMPVLFLITIKVILEVVGKHFKELKT